MVVAESASRFSIGRGTFRGEGKTTVIPSLRPKHGIVDLNPDGTFTYTPDFNFTGEDYFSYDLAYGGQTKSATVKITAYDFTIYGGLEATLEQISADTIRDEKKSRISAADVLGITGRAVYRSIATERRVE